MMADGPAFDSGKIGEMMGIISKFFGESYENQTDSDEDTDEKTDDATVDFEESRADRKRAIDTLRTSTAELILHHAGS